MNLVGDELTDDKLVFEPHYVTVDGTQHWPDCTVPTDDGDLPCEYRCTNSGRYCAPEAMEEIQYFDGMHVVQENLRQICVWKWATETALDDSLWWQYSMGFQETCIGSGWDEELTTTPDRLADLLDAADPEQTGRN